MCDDDDDDDDELFLWYGWPKKDEALFPTGTIVRDPHYRESPPHTASRILQKFSGKHLCGVSVLIKLQFSGLQLKKRLWQKCFPVNFVKFLQTPFLQNISR